MKSSQNPSKDELERQKLALEIRELQRKWWQRPVYLSVLLPMVLASLTVLAGILSGYFNRERSELRRNLEALKREKTALLETQSAIQQANLDAEKRLREVNEQYQVKLHDLGELLATLALDQAGLDSLKEAVRNKPRTIPRRSKPAQENSSPTPTPSPSN